MKARQSTPPESGRAVGRLAGVASWKVAAAGGVVIAVVAASFVLPGVFGKSGGSSADTHAAMGAEHGAGLSVGAVVPTFSARDLLSGNQISTASLSGGKTLLFFSEGVMCQACFEQIQGIEKVGAELQRRGIRLVSITPDSPDDLRQAVSQYGITTPVIADADRSLSNAFNVLGKGMHDNTPGHAFVLIDRGKVVWYRDYWLAPYRVMYVKPAALLADIPSGA